MEKSKEQLDIDRGYLPGHIFKVLRGPYVGQIGQWDCIVREQVIGLCWPELGQSPFGGPEHVFFRLQDLEDITDQLV